jgi:hypothetical protein
MYNSLRLLFVFDKGWPHFDLDKSVNFFCCGERRVLQGVFGKTGVLDVVFLW